MKRPYFQFYPNDWRSDSGVRLCSLAARGLWLELLCLMHDIGQQEGNRYGYLEMKGKRLDGAKLARLTGIEERQLCLLLDELQEAGVFERDEDAVIFSRRFVRDANLHEIRKQAGSKGGNKSQANHKQTSSKRVSKRVSKRASKLQPTASRAIDRAPSEVEVEYNINKEGEGNGRGNHSEIKELYLELCPSLPKIRTVSPIRKKAISARAREKISFEELFSLAEASDFLTGRDIISKGTFRADFDWLLNPNNCTKVLEGKYANRKSTTDKEKDYANAWT